MPAGQDSGGANRLTSPINADTLGAAGGAESHALSIAELAAHTHAAGSYAVNSGGDAAGDGPHVVFRNGTSRTSAVVGTSASTGSGSAHTNVQPTIILNYIIKT